MTAAGMVRIGDGGSRWAAVDAVSEYYWALHGLMAVESDGNGRGAVRRSVVQAARFKLRCSFNVRRRHSRGCGTGNERKCLGDAGMKSEWYSQGQDVQ